MHRTVILRSPSRERVVPDEELAQKELVPLVASAPLAPLVTRWEALYDGLAGARADSCLK